MTHKAILVAFLSILLSGCSPDYAIVAPKEIVYVETSVEVPVYIGTEVPVESGEVWVDSFTQPTSVNGVDILWVIDTSGSMSDDRDELLAGIAAMIAVLPESGWRLSMMSNDPGSASIESQFPLVPGDDIQDAEDMYDQMGTGHQEEGFDATYEYIINNSYASTWMRSDAALLTVFVSDEDDQSNDYFPTVSSFTSWYNGLRSSVFLASIIHLDPSESSCNGSTLHTGERYEEATNHFNGIVVDICSEDWSPGMTDASSQIEPFESWPLTYQPIQNTIRVFIDSQVNWDWTYDVNTNSVLFTTIPSGSSLVEVGYIIDQTTISTDSGIDTGA